MSLCQVGPGKTYPTLYAAEYDNFGLGTSVLPDALVVECFPMEDTVACTVGGFTTTAVNKIEIRTAFGYEHAGVWDDDVYRMKAVTATALTSTQRYTTVIGLQFDVAPISTNYVRGWTSSALNNAAVYCIARGTNGTASNSAGFRPAYASTTCVVVCCLGYDFDNTGGVGIVLAGNGASCYSSTLYNCTIGVSSAGTNCIAKNIISLACGDGFSGSFSSNSANNTSDITADAPGTNATTGSVLFVNAGAYDFHLHGDDTVARNTGGDLATEFASLGISLFDIDGQEITSWSRGADIQAGAAGGSEPLHTISLPAVTVIGAVLGLDGQSERYVPTTVQAIGMADVLSLVGGHTIQLSQVKAAGMVSIHLATDVPEATQKNINLSPVRGQVMTQITQIHAKHNPQVLYTPGKCQSMLICKGRRYGQLTATKAMLKVEIILRRNGQVYKSYEPVEILVNQDVAEILFSQDPIDLTWPMPLFVQEQA